MFYIYIYIYIYICILVSDRVWKSFQGDVRKDAIGQIIFLESDFRGGVK